MEIDLYQEQLKLEEQARMMGVNRFHENLTRKVETGQESSTYYGSALMKRAVAPLAQAIEDFKSAASTGKAGRRHNALRFFELAPAHDIAYLTAKTILDTYTRPRPLGRVASQVGQLVEDEVRYADFQEQAPGLWSKVLRQTSRSQDRHKRTVLMHTYQKHVAHWEGWAPGDKLHLGTKLVELFIDATGFAEMQFVVTAKNRTQQMIHPTPELVEWLEKSRDQAAGLQPAHLPMVVKPTPWSGPFDGGYITPGLRPVPFVKTRNRAYLEELTSIPTQLAGVYEAVNTLQEVPWRINKPVIEVMHHLWAQGSAIADLPQRDETPVAPYPFPGTEKEDLTEEQLADLADWKRTAAQIHSHNVKLRSKRIQLARIIGIADQFTRFDAIYFPHNLDFRGRVYPIPLFLNPQGSDISKGLLEFSKGKPIGDGTGPGWLAIHGANVWGYDKADLAGRIDWVEEHQDRIVSCAKDPLSDLWWTEADKPWGFLAFCFEWASYLEKGADHMTHIAIALDGSCSGLQHFSAALRDEVGGAAVNLVPSEKPADVYQEVANIVVDELRSIASTSGREDAVLAARILDFGVDRKTTKRATMTLPYGSTQFSCRSFVREWLDDAGEKKTKRGEINPLVGREAEASVLLASLVWDAIGQVVVAARSAMDWLRDTAKVLSKEDLPLFWTTPDGLPIMQEYRSFKARRVKTRFGHRFVFLSLQEEQDNLDGRRQANGVAPNWVHSMDGTHLRMAILYAKDNGVDSFAVVHDSFGTHACDTDLLGACLRESMVDLYQGDVLEDFRSEVCRIAPTSGKIKVKPAFGNLDLNTIKESDYVFA